MNDMERDHIDTRDETLMRFREAYYATGGSLIKMLWWFLTHPKKPKEKKL